MDFLREMEFPRELHFGEAEFAERLRGVQQGMAKEDLDVLVLHRKESIHYLTGYQTFGGGYQCLLVPQVGNPAHILRFLESFLSNLYSCLEAEQVTIWDDTDDPYLLTAQKLKEMGFSNSNIGLEAEYVAASVSKQLNNDLPDASWRPADALVREAREIKSKAELKYMRKAGELSVAGAKAAFEAAKVGATDNEVAAAAAAKMLSEGSEYMPHDPIVTSGWRSGIPHTTFERQVLRKGDTILVEHTACYRRYHAPIMQTAVLGQPSAKVREMADVVLEALGRATRAMKPGVTSGEVDDACRSYIEDAGYYFNFRKRTGYSVGLSWPDSLSLKKDDPTVLQAGMVFHLPVALRDYGKSVVGFSVTAVVTDEGIDVLTEYPKGLVVL
jgi:Xaa-Pro dipeptidase